MPMQLVLGTICYLGGVIERDCTKKRAYWRKREFWHIITQDTLLFFFFFFWGVSTVCHGQWIQHLCLAVFSPFVPFHTLLVYRSPWSLSAVSLSEDVWPLSRGVQDFLPLTSSTTVMEGCMFGKAGSLLKCWTMGGCIKVPFWNAGSTCLVVVAALHHCQWWKY